MTGKRTTSARFPELAPAAGHYESFYLKASHPSEPQAIWLRYTAHKRPGEEPRGSLWFTLFDSRAGAPAAVKETRADLGASQGEYIHVGDAVMTPRTASGDAMGEGRSARWELGYESSEEPLRHLPRGWMYRAALPRTKLESPLPDARFHGHAELDGRRVEVEGWRGMVGHNWGSEHAERWIWVHGASFDEDDEAWIDAGLGRIGLGPVTTPWIANGVLRLGGRRHRLGGADRIRCTEVRERPDACELVLPGSSITVQATMGAAREAFVGWVYADPDGSQHHAVNCSVADMALVVSRPGEGATALTLRGGAAYELGMREHDHGILIQPFPDG